MELNEKLRKRIITIALIVVSLLSIFVISPLVSNPNFHSDIIKTLDNKKMSILGLSTGSIGVATAIAVVPGDSTTPLANQIVQLSSCFMIVIGAIFLEKILLSLTGYLAFTFLIPIACILFILYIYFNKNTFKILAIKLGVFGLLVFIVVPVSVQISDVIENTYQASLTQSIEQTNNEVNNSDSQQEKNGWDAFTSMIQNAINSIGNTASSAIKQGEQMISNLIDTIAVFVVTSCIIPILTLLTFIWLIKIVFHVTLPTNTVKNSIKKFKIKKVAPQNITIDSKSNESK